MSTMKDVEKAFRIFKKNKCKFILMHCVSSCPAIDEQTVSGTKNSDLIFIEFQF